MMIPNEIIMTRHSAMTPKEFMPPGMAEIYRLDLPTAPKGGLLTAASRFRDKRITFVSGQWYSEPRTVDIAFARWFNDEELLELKFSRLADQWRRETACISSITKRTFHPAYLRIVGMGKAVVPVMLRDLARHPSGDWLAALSLIEDENPVSPEDMGNMVAMAKAWVGWGRKRGICE